MLQPVFAKRAAFPSRYRRLPLRVMSSLPTPHHQIVDYTFRGGPVISDLRYSLRCLCQTPIFTAVAIVTLALGIGANTAIFSILDPLLIRTLPIPRPSELVWLNSTGTLGPAEVSELNTYETYRQKSRAFSGIVAYTRIAPYQLSTRSRTFTADGELVSPNYFSVLGVSPSLGRAFEESTSAAPSIILSHALWRRAFDSSPKVIDQFVSFGDQADASRSSDPSKHAYAVVGVAPPGFFGTEVGESPDFYIALDKAALPSQDYWQAQGVTILGRLSPGIGIAKAQSSLDPLLSEAVKNSQIPLVELAENYSHSLVIPVPRGLSHARGAFGPSARVLMCVVALLLLIACANVANLLLSRATSRRREFSVRMALGSGRWRIVRQIFAETALIGLAGMLAALLLGISTSHLLVAALSTPASPISLPNPLNIRTLFFLFGTLVFASIFCAIVPAITVIRSAPTENLKTHAASSAAMSPLARALTVSQVALSIVALTGTGLLLRSLINLETFDAGFRRDGVLIATLDGYSASRSRDEIASFYDKLLLRASALPGVQSAAFAGFAPISGKEIGVNVVVDGASRSQSAPVNIRFVGVSPRYFETMGIPILAGRDFTLADIHPESPSYRSTNVAVINRTMSRRYFGEADPIGKRFRFVEGDRPPLEIVGLVADAKYDSLREPPTDFFYIPGTHGDLAIRTSLPPASLADPLRAAVHQLDPSVNVAQLRTLRSRVDDSLHPDRLIASLCAAFGVLALFLACVGLFGSLAYSVARRTCEIGIRVALGAQSRNIFRLVLSQGLRLATLGIVIGIAAALAASRILASLLFNVSRTDVSTYAGVSALLLVAAATACYMPARRAARVDPLSALRDE
jgi:predicted permease